MQRNIWNTDTDGVTCAIQARDYFHSQTYHNCTFAVSDPGMLRADSKFVRASFYCRNNPAVFQRTHVELRPGLEGWVIEFIPDKEEFWTVLEPPWLAFITEQELVFGYTFTKVDIDNEEPIPSEEKNGGKSVETAPKEMKKKRRARYLVPERVALALFLHKKGDYTTERAAQIGMQLGYSTISSRKDDPEVKELLGELEHMDMKELYKFKHDVLNDRARRNVK